MHSSELFLKPDGQLKNIHPTNNLLFYKLPHKTQICVSFKTNYPKFLNCLINWKKNYFFKYIPLSVIPYPWNSGSLSFKDFENKLDINNHLDFVLQISWELVVQM